MEYPNRLTVPASFCQPAGFVLMFLLLQTSASAAEFTVNSTRDDVDANSADGFCETAIANECTLRAAIQQANALPGLDTVMVPAGTYLLTRGGRGEDLAAEGDLDIKDGIVILGHSKADTIIDGQKNDRIFEVVGLFDVKLSGLRLINGDAKGEAGGAIRLSTQRLSGSNDPRIPNFELYESTIENCVTTGGGGAISASNYGNILISASVITNNSGGINGGAIFSSLSIGTLTINNKSEITNNRAGLGGGVFADGAIEIHDAFIARNAAEYSGGGIYAMQGVTINGEPATDLTITYSTIRANTASGGDGGGIYAYGVAKDRVTISDTWVLDNRAVNSGGGIALGLIGGIESTTPGVTTLNRVVVSGNSAGRFGGGVGANVLTSLVNSTVRNNSAGIAGGGLHLSNPTVKTMIKNSLIDANRVVNNGLFNSKDADGGGVYVGSGSLDFVNVTISNNRVETTAGGSARGGGMSSQPNVGAGAATTLTNSTLAYNTSAAGGGNIDALASVELTNSIIAGVAGTSNCNETGKVISKGYNIDSDGTCKLASIGDLGSVDPGLDILAANGGATDTFALKPGSKAIDAGYNTVCPKVDQRLFFRADGRCDMGAFEVSGRDFVSELSFKTATVAVDETLRSLTITVLKSQNFVSVGDVSVDYAVVGGSAEQNKDYVLTQGTLNFPNGTDQATFVITLIDDQIFEGNETIVIGLANATGNARLSANPTLTVTIVDNETSSGRGRGTLSFLQATPVVAESGGRASITVIRTGGSTGVVFVDFVLDGGSAAVGADFMATNGTLMFADGVTEQTLVVDILNDSEIEPDETIIFKLTQAAGGASVGRNNVTTVTIIDDDSVSATGNDVNVPASPSSGGGGADFMLSIYALFFHFSRRWVRSCRRKRSRGSAIIRIFSQGVSRHGRHH